MSYENILDEIYANKEEAIALFKKYDLEQTISKTIILVDSKTQEIASGKMKIGDISANFIIGVNSRIKLVQNKEEKDLLKVLISDIGFHVLNHVIKSSPDRAFEIISEVKASAQVTCQMNDYDYKELESFLPFGKLSALSQTLVQRKNLLSGNAYYLWLEKNQFLDGLAHDLKSHNVIKSTKEFRSLFSEGSSLKVHFNQEKLDFLVVLFDILKERNLISTRGNKGHFHPLAIHGVDFENNSLFKKDPKTIKYTIKKNMLKWNNLRAKCEALLEHYTVKRLTSSLP